MARGWMAAIAMLLLLSPSAPLALASGETAHVSPGRYSLFLGDSPALVRLSYPNSSILVGANGDLLFELTLNGNYSSIDVYVPPEFRGLDQGDTSNVWTNATNDYNLISIRIMDSWDVRAPGWWRVRVSNVTSPKSEREEYGLALRLFNLTAPSVAGRYFFKVFLNETISIGAKNFPTVVVEADINPAYISGTVRYGGPDPKRYGEPLDKPGKVLARGLTPDGRRVEAVAYFNETAKGAYTLYGLAEGTYNLTFSASGFPPVTLDRPISVHRGQSLEGIDAYIGEGLIANITVWSKCRGRPIPWGDKLPIAAELLDMSFRSVASTSFPGVPSHLHYTDDHSYTYTLSLNATEYTGHVPQDNAAYVSGIPPGDYYVRAYVWGYIQTRDYVISAHNGTSCINLEMDLHRSGRLNIMLNFKDLPGARAVSKLTERTWIRVRAYDSRGKLSALEFSRANPGDSQALIELRGLRNYRGAFDYGLPPGDYWIEVEAGGFLQLKPLIATVGPECSLTEVSLEMVKGGRLNITITSMDWERPRVPRPWAHPGSRINVEVINRLGEVVAILNATQPASDSAIHLEYGGLYTGLEPGDYMLMAYTVGYIQRAPVFVSVYLNSTSHVEIDLEKGVDIDLTVILKKEGIPIPRKIFGNPSIRVEVYDRMGNIMGANISMIYKEWNLTTRISGFKNYAGNPAVRWANFYDATDGYPQKDWGLPPGEYSIRVLIPGYEQTLKAEFEARGPGSVLVIVSLEKLGRVSGMVFGFDFLGRPRPISWAGISAHRTEAFTCSLDGRFELWLPKGDYAIGVAAEGYGSKSIGLRVEWASETYLEFFLGEGRSFPR
ncbi:MAG: carboxypeptidase-like regulatory domain-containing protein [Candidatus Bathyarchaeia archaeon]